MLSLFKGYYDAEHHVFSFSGGKDSTCMLLKSLEVGYRVDEIIFIDTGMEFPAMYEHIDIVEKYIGRPITRLKSKKSFEHYMFEHKKRNGQQGYGWPDFRNRWCTQLLKKSVISKYLRQYEKAGIKIIEYHGIAADEKSRAKNNKEKIVKYPLIEWGMTEDDCLKYCYDKGFYWNGLYEKFDRLSCWACPLQSLKELKVLYSEFPDLWSRLKEMEDRAFNKFRLDYTIDELEMKFCN